MLLTLHQSSLCISDIELMINLCIIQIAYDKRNLLTQADAYGIVMLAPKVWTAPSYSPAGSYVYVVAL